LVAIFYQTDALVIYSDAQSGLFAIYSFLYFKKPVFLKKGSRLDHFFKDLNIKIFYLEDFNNDLFEDKLLQSNKTIVKTLLNSNESILNWNRFFHYLS
jgi:hypothetical protein